MQRQSWKLVLVVGLGSVLLGGCANFKWKGGDNSLGASSRDEKAQNTDPVSLSSLSKDESDGKEAKVADKPQNKIMEGQFSLARLCERRGEAEQAEQIYRELVKKEPKDARIHHRLGVLELQKCNFEQAEEQFSTAKSLASPNAELLSDIGYCYYLQQKLPEAENMFKEALKIDPSNATAINNLALVLGRQGRYQESKDLFMRNNSEAEVYANLGYVLAQNGELAKAKQMYLRALTLDNKMRVAAKAMLQIDEREQALGRVASSSSEQHSAASRTTEEEIKTVSYENEELNSNSAKESAKNIQTLGAVVVDRPS